MIKIKIKANKAENNGFARCSYVALQQVFFLFLSLLSEQDKIYLYNRIAEIAQC